MRRRGDKCPVDIVLHGERSSLFDIAFPFFLFLFCHNLVRVTPVSFHSPQKRQHSTRHRALHNTPHTHINVHEHAKTPQHTHTSPSPGGQTVPPRGCVLCKPCFFACVRIVCCSGDGQSLLSTLLKLHVRIQGLLLGCAVILILWCKSQFFSTQSLVCKPLHDSQQ